MRQKILLIVGVLGLSACIPDLENPPIAVEIPSYNTPDEMPESESGGSTSLSGSASGSDTASEGAVKDCMPPASGALNGTLSTDMVYCADE